MAQCEPMTSYHYTGNAIDGAGVPEWGSGYPDVVEGNLEGGAKRSARRARKSQRKGRKSQRKSTKRRVNNVRRSRRSSKR